MLKSVHIKNTVAGSSVLSKLWSADFVLISADVHIIENYHNIDRTEDHATVFLKWADFNEQNFPRKSYLTFSFSVEKAYTKGQ